MAPRSVVEVVRTPGVMLLGPPPLSANGPYDRPVTLRSPLTRRAVLRGAISAASAVVVAPLVACGGGDPRPSLSEGSLPSRFMTSPVRWRMAVPGSGAARGLVVALHGFGSNADMAFDLGLPDLVDPTLTALVSVDGGNGYWHARDDGTDSGAMVRDDLIPLALGRAGLPAGTPVTLLGWSMGGFGALLIASDLGRRRVRNVVAVSAALWLKGSQTPAAAYDGKADFDQHTIFRRTTRLHSIPVRLDCGTSDPFVAANRQLAERLPTAVHHFTSGGHDFSFWSSRAADQMRWVAGT